MNQNKESGGLTEGPDRSRVKQSPDKNRPIVDKMNQMPSAGDLASITANEIQQVIKQ